MRPALGLPHALTASVEADVREMAGMAFAVVVHFAIVAAFAFGPASERPAPASPPLPALFDVEAYAEASPAGPVMVQIPEEDVVADRVIPPHVAPRPDEIAPVNAPVADPAPAPAPVAILPPPPPFRSRVPDRSAPAHIARIEWICPWPRKADALDIDHATVHIEVEVTEDGRPLDAHIVDDPGSGFGSEALRCAMKQPYTPALDRNGQPTRGSTRAFAVQFDRFHAAR
jgi:hypothetical protein